MNKIIGRAEEQKILERFLKSGKAEFLAIYGRRRVGKTFLIHTYFSNQNCIYFHATGIRDGLMAEQIAQFTNQTGQTFYGGAMLGVPRNWFDTFDLLQKAIKASRPGKKIIIFLDEFPWMATKKSKLLQALEYFWNQHWNHNKNIKLVVCGSSASWILKNVVNNTGGLYNRITYSMALDPFNLKETRDFLKFKGILLNQEQILQIYMALGGIPMYLDHLHKGQSAQQGIDSLCFQKNGLLLNEFEKLFASLFEDFSTHLALVRAVATFRYGVGKSELAKICKITDGGRLTKKLKELEEAGFIMSFIPYGHKERGHYYKVADEYMLFYLHWIEPNRSELAKHERGTGYWQQKASTAAFKSWSGFAFESVCYKHLSNIRAVLGISIDASVGTWKYRAKDQAESGAQIDLLFDRSDGIINLCEIKFSEHPFAIDKSYAKALQNKIDVFQTRTKTKKQIFLSLIASAGVKKNMYSEEIIISSVELKDFFKE